MAATLEPDVNAYGSKARFEALADVLEVAALRNRTWTTPDLADYVSDRGWLRLDFDHYRPPEEGRDSLGEENDLAYSIAEGVFAVLNERLAVYGEVYPFSLTGGRLRPRDTMEPAHKRYLALLAIATLHAYQVEAGGLRPERIVEDLVAQTLRSMGLRAVNVGAVSRSASSFEETVRESAAEIGLEGAPRAASRSRHANEAGVDVLARLDFGDQGYGKWVFIGQVTCGKSETWPGKAAEPSRAKWRQFLSLASDPVKFLAVPQEIPARYRFDLCEQNENGVLLLDRRRLAKPERPLLDVEERLVEALYEARFEAIG